MKTIIVYILMLTMHSPNTIDSISGMVFYSQAACERAKQEVLEKLHKVVNYATCMPREVQAVK